MPAHVLDIIPFRFLTHAARRKLATELTERRHAAGEVVVEQWADDDQVYLLEAGRVDIIDHRPGGEVPLGMIEPGQYFGERAALFGARREVEIRAATDVVVHTLPGDRFLELLSDEPAFAHALGNILRDKQGIFAAFDRFLAELTQQAAKGHVIINKLLHLYRPLKPAIHGGANDDAIDFSGLTYAVRRLPDNVSRSMTYFLTDDLPWIYDTNEFTAIRTAARRRTIWEMLPGKSLVLLREGVSDLADFVTLLCLYAVEARKIRHRLRNGLTDEEVAGLRKVWPDNLDRVLHEIRLHHEDFALHTFKQLNNYNRAHSEEWTHQVAAACVELMGAAPNDLDVPVHIISSNTHSVGNTLSAWLRDNGDRIVAWGQEHRPNVVAQNWTHREDLVVGLARDYLKAHPDEAAAMAEQDGAVGCVTLGTTAFTGIGVQLFDTSAYGDSQRQLLVNIDYAFGQQASQILAALINLFGEDIRSINVLGKAGGLYGNRGDIMVATSLIEQTNDLIHAPKMAVDTERLAARAPDRNVHVGPMLTVVGTLLQNAKMLEFYKHLWKCVGLEMEGSHYAAEIVQAQHLGILREDVALRFLYYTSDLPLNHDATLSQAMTLSEGVPSLYACTREVLESIF